MPDFLGTVLAGAQLGLDAILVKPVRSIGPFTAHVTIKETHTDELQVTEQPVDQGANITDHAFIKPAELQIECAWSNSPPSSNVVQSLQQAVTGTAAIFNTIDSSINSGNSPSQVKEVYARLLQLQRSRIPFAVFTGKRTYDNMLVTRLSVQTDKETENSLHVSATFRQILIAQVQVRSIGAPAENQENPETTQPVVDKGMKQLTPASTFNPGAALKAGIDAVSAKATSVVNTISTKLFGL
jgi:hypothetical protein